MISTRSRDSYVITFWIIGLVVLGTLFWLAVLAIALLLCYKRRYRMEAMPGGGKSRDIPDNSVTLNKATFHHNDPEPPATFTVYNEEKTREPPITHSNVIVDESPDNSPAFHRKYEYETQSDSLKFNEESPEWESMDIQLRIDPSGKQEPIITRREKPKDDSDNGKNNSNLLVFFYLSFVLCTITPLLPVLYFKSFLKILKALH